MVCHPVRRAPLTTTALGRKAATAMGREAAA